jgi:hypothetical protein
MIKLRMKRWVGNVAHLGEMRNVYRSLVGKTEWKRSLVRPSHRCEDNTKMGLKETSVRLCIGFIWFMTGTGWKWVLVNMAMNLRVP